MKEREWERPCWTWRWRLRGRWRGLEDWRARSSPPRWRHSDCSNTDWSEWPRLRIWWHRRWLWPKLSLTSARPASGQCRRSSPPLPAGTPCLQTRCCDRCLKKSRKHSLESLERMSQWCCTLGILPAGPPESLWVDVVFAVCPPGREQSDEAQDESYNEANEADQSEWSADALGFSDFFRLVTVRHLLPVGPVRRVRHYPQSTLH